MCKCVGQEVRKRIEKKNPLRKQKEGNREKNKLAKQKAKITEIETINKTESYLPEKMNR